MSPPQKISRTQPQPPKIARQGLKRLRMTTKKLSVNMSKPQRLIETQPNAKNSQKVHNKLKITNKNQKEKTKRQKKILQNETYQYIQVN